MKTNFDYSRFVTKMANNVSIKKNQTIQWILISATIVFAFTTSYYFFKYNSLQKISANLQAQLDKIENDHEI